MEVSVIVEMFKGGVIPKIRGVYQDEMKANDIKNDCCFAFISKQKIIQAKEEKLSKNIFVVVELLKLNVPRIIGVFKSQKLAEEMANCCEYETQIIEEQLN